MVVRGTAIRAGVAPGTAVRVGATVVAIMAMLATTAGATLAADITEPRYVAEAASAEEAFTEPVHSTVEAAFMAAVADSTVAAVAAGNIGHSKRTTAGSSSPAVSLLFFCQPVPLARILARMAGRQVASVVELRKQTLRRRKPLWPM